MLGQASLSFLLCSNELLLASLANELNLGLRSASHAEQTNNITLVDGTQLRV